MAKACKCLVGSFCASWVLGRKVQWFPVRHTIVVVVVVTVADTAEDTKLGSGVR